MKFIMAIYIHVQTTAVANWLNVSLNCYAICRRVHSDDQIRSAMMPMRRINTEASPPQYLRPENKNVQVRKH